MNYTTAACGHPVIAVGAPNSIARRECEMRPCGRGCKVWIVCAKLEDDVEVVRPGQPDIGIAPKFKTVKKVMAMSWLCEGDESDVDKAEAWTKTKEGEAYTVFCYPTTENDPLGRAKKDLLAMKS